MRFIWNLIGTFGLLVLILLIMAIVQMGPSIKSLAEFDDQALTTYAEIAKNLLETGNGATATIWKYLHAF